MSKSAARKIAKPAGKSKASGRVAKAKPARPAKPKLAKVTKFPAPKKAAPPPPKKAPAQPPPRPTMTAPNKPPTVPPPQNRPAAPMPANKSLPPQASRPLPPLPALTKPAQVQQPRQSLARSFYWSELRVGDDLPPLTKPPIDRVQIVRYAAASGDFNRLHVDEPFAVGAGFPGIFAPGALAMAFVGQLLSSWLRRGHVRKLGARFVKLVWPGDELTCHGRIADLRKDGGACYADVELWAENQKGELVLRGQATCELYEAPATGAGDSGGLLFAIQQGPASKATKGPPSKPPKKK